MSWKHFRTGLSVQMGSPSRKLVLLALLYACNDDGTGVCLTTDEIAKTAQCSARTAQREITAFVKCGLLEPIGHGAPERGAPRAYRVDIATLNWIAINGWEKLAVWALLEGR